MDDFDRKLVALLRQNARRGVSELAAALGVARATIRSRMDRLEQVGEIQGYTVVLRSDATDIPVRGVVLIAVEGRSTDKVISTLGGLAEVTTIHTTHGRWDLVVELGATDLIALDGVLRRIRLIPGIAGSETNLLLATHRSTQAKSSRCTRS